MMIRSTLALFTILALCSLSLARAQEPEKKIDKRLAITDPALADADFAYQGEYASRGWGLQVVAQGEGNFAALLYAGGLPGAGWNRAEPAKFQGQLENETLQLQGDERSIHVTPQQAQLFNNSGILLAQLSKQQRVSNTLGLQPPRGAEILFNGSDLSHFQKARLSDDGYLQMGTMTQQTVGDFRLHLEFRLPYMPHARGQGRANSGVYIQQRYEVQILDSFGLAGANNECGAIYTQHAPEVNMAFPPLAWQTYDIWFRQPRWSEDGKTKLEPAKITVLHNGVAVQWQYELKNKTGGGKPEGAEEFPIALQDHGNPVVFRNIWLVPGEGEYPQATFTTQYVCASPCCATAMACCPNQCRQQRCGMIRRLLGRRCR